MFIKYKKGVVSCFEVWVSQITRILKTAFVVHGVIIGVRVVLKRTVVGD